jgi:hypothetical protein
MTKEISLVDSDKKRLIALRTQTGCSLISIARRYKEFLADIASGNVLTNECKYEIPQDLLKEIVSRSQANESVIESAYNKFMQVLMDEREVFLKQLKDKAVKEFKVWKCNVTSNCVRVFSSSVESDFYLNTTEFHTWINETSEIIFAADENKTLDQIMTPAMIERRNLMMAMSSEFVGCDLYNHKYFDPSAEIYVAGNQKFIGTLSFYPKLLLIEHKNGSEESLQIISSKILSGNLQIMTDLDALKKVPFIASKIDEANIVSFKVYK